jgi:hypothetical protein
MATQRTLKLNLLADVDKFGKGLDKAGKDAKGFSGKVSKYGKVAAGAFAAVAAAAGAMAIKIGVDSVKAAIEDEKSSRILEQQLIKTLGANKELTAGVEDYISATQLRVGVQDDKLRPSFARLVRSTKDAGEAQKLLNLALDISVATGKPLETVANALGKAYDGNAASLGRLGLGLDESIIKSKDFDVIGKELTRTFGGFANEEAKSLDGQLRIFNITVDELKENLGKKLLPVMGNLLEKVMEVSKAFSGEDPQGLSARARELKGEMGDTGSGSLGRSIAILADSFAQLFKAFTDDGDEATDGMQELADALLKIAKAINFVADAYGKIKKLGKGALDLINIGPDGAVRYNPQTGKYEQKAQTGIAMGGTVRAGQAYNVGEFGKEVFIPRTSGQIIPNNRLGGGGNTFIFNGVIDGESARRSIERIMQQSTRRTGAVNLAGSQL